MFNLITFILTFPLIFNKSKTRSMIESSNLYKNEICSYHGIPSDDSGNIICECFPSYVNEPREDKIKYIGNQIVQCSYQKKKRFKTFFLAGILPMGFDYYYLGYTFYFSLIFITFIIVIVNNCVHFYLFYQSDKQNDESRYNYDEKNENIDRNNINTWYKNNKKLDQKDKMKRCLKIYNIINKTFLILFAIYWIVDIILQGKGIIKDVNGIETDNDMSILFSRVEV